MIKELTESLKQKYEKFGANLPLDWQNDLYIFFKNIGKVEEKFDYYIKNNNELRNENFTMKNKIKRLEADNQSLIVEVVKLKDKIK